MDRAPMTPMTRAERVRLEKAGFHEYDTYGPVYPSIPLVSGSAEPPVSGLEHEDGPRDEAASGLRHPSLYEIDGIRYFLYSESSGIRYPLPLIISFLSPADRVRHLQVSIACWQEESIWSKLVQTKDARFSIEDRTVTQDWTHVVRRSRPQLFGANFPPSCVRLF